MSTPVPVAFSNPNQYSDSPYSFGGFISSYKTITTIHFEEVPVSETKEMPPFISSISKMPLSTHSQIQTASELFNEESTSNIITTKTYGNVEDFQQSLAYRKLKRYELLEAMFKTVDSFNSSLGQPESARYYTMLKEIINETWKFTGSDEYFSMVLSSIDSITRFNLWRDFTSKQAKELLSAIKLLMSKDIELKDATIITRNFHNAGLNLFPFEDIYEEKKKTK